MSRGILFRSKGSELPLLPSQLQRTVRWGSACFFGAGSKAFYPIVKAEEQLQISEESLFWRGHDSTNDYFFILIHDTICIQLCNVGDGDTVEFDVLRRKGYGGSKCYRPYWSSSASSKYAADYNHYRCYPHGRGFLPITRITKRVRIRKRTRDGRVVQKARSNRASPTSGHSSHPTTHGDL